MTKKETARKYGVRLSDDERARLNRLIAAGRHPARQLLKARILLKADVSDAGEGWTDSRISEALDTSPDTTTPDTPAASRGRPGCGPDAQIFARIGSAAYFRRGRRSHADCAGLWRAAEGGVRWTLELLEEQVVELKIVERASDNTIGRMLKETGSSPTCKNNGSSRRVPTLPL